MDAPPINAAAVATPSPTALPGTPGALPVWSPLSTGPAKPADFASDLAHLMALLTQGGGESSDAELPTLSERSAPAAPAESEDAVSSLWAELGLSLQREVPPPIAGVPAPAAPATAGGALEAATSSASPAAPNPLLAAAPGSSAGDIAVATGTDTDVDAIQLMADDAPAPTIQNLASLAALAPAEPLRHAAVASPPPPAAVDILHPQAPQQLAETVAWHVGKGVSEVRIRLNPEELGPLDIQLKLDGDKVSVRFDMADSSVRDVVQTSLPSLSSLLSARGLQLDQAQVFSQSRGHGTPQHPQSSPSSFAQQSAEGNAENPVVSAVRTFVRRGLLDDYA